MDWFNVLIFGMIQFFTVIVVFVVKRKLLWTAPLISSMLAFIIYVIELEPMGILTVFNNNEWRGFFVLAMLMHFVIAAVMTAIAYLIAYILKRRQM
ncbi:MAG: hypothetical protein E7432_05330 [Ruminococcaceae bacterium]|nr:hypothetical protein [Oscillospiraceae bacterium]